MIKNVYKILPFHVRSSIISQQFGLLFLICWLFKFHFMLDPDPDPAPEPEGIVSAEAKNNGSCGSGSTNKDKKPSVKVPGFYQLNM